MSPTTNLLRRTYSHCIQAAALSWVSCLPPPPSRQYHRQNYNHHHHPTTTFHNFCRYVHTDLPLRTSSLLRIHPEVAEALACGAPVVALESTIISHGMPYPRNVETALAVEDVVRKQGCVPATIAIFDGKGVVGLTVEEIEMLGGKTGTMSPKTSNYGSVDNNRSSTIGGGGGGGGGGSGNSTLQSVRKTSRRDLPLVLATGSTGATTVAGTMILASMAGIDVFVTGGIGGVHRGAAQTFDISADLTELARTRVAVVCAGVKSILDIPATLEVLETQGVPVYTLGDTDDFPAFFGASSGYKSMACLKTPADAAAALLASAQLGLGTGSVIAVPIPAQHDAGNEVEACIEQALKEAEHTGISGKDATPFLLSRVAQLSDGKSLEANIALIMNNAEAGGQIAAELASLRNHQEAELHHVAAVGDEKNNTAANTEKAKKLCNATNKLVIGDAVTPAADGDNVNTAISRSSSSSSSLSSSPRPLVIGGAVVDIIAYGSAAAGAGTTAAGRVEQRFGGVGRNVAEALQRLGCAPRFLGMVGADAAGVALRAHLTDDLDLGLEHNDVETVQDSATAIYNAVVDEGTGEMVHAVGGMDIHARLDSEFMARHTQAIQDAPIVCIDGNVPPAGLRALVTHINESETPAEIWFEPTSAAKAHATAAAGLLPDLTYVSPNALELCAMVEALEEESKTRRQNHHDNHGEEEASGSAPAAAKKTEPAATYNANAPPPGTRLGVNMDKMSPAQLRAHAEKLALCVAAEGPIVLASLGAHGLVAVSRSPEGGGFEVQHCEALPLGGHKMGVSGAGVVKTLGGNGDQPLNVTGAGDSFVGGCIAGLLRKVSLDEAITLGLNCARASVQSLHPVAPEIAEWKIK